MKYKQVEEHFGGFAQTAIALDRSVSCIAKWKKDGIPIHAQWEIQGRTNGVLLADKPKKAVK